MKNKNLIFNDFKWLTQNLNNLHRFYINYLNFGKFNENLFKFYIDFTYINKPSLSLSLDKQQILFKYYIKLPNFTTTSSQKSLIYVSKFYINYLNFT